MHASQNIVMIVNLDRTMVLIILNTNLAMVLKRKGIVIMFLVQNMKVLMKILLEITKILLEITNICGLAQKESLRVFMWILLLIM